MTDCSKVLDELKSDDNEVIREAAFQAAELGCTEAVPQLAELLKSNHLGLQEAADQALRSIGGKGAVHAVVPLLRSDDAPVRNLSMDILREVGAKDFASLVALVHDEDADIRIFATDILGSTNSFMAVDPLCDALLKDPEVNVRYQAAVSLGDLANPAAAKCLNKAMQDDEWVQYAVIEALAKIKHSSSVDALVKALNTSSDLVASMIVDALGDVGNIKAVTMLLRHLDKAPTALRNKIVKAIVGILGGKSLKLLSANEREKLREYMLVALKDEDVDVQDAAISGLSFVGGEKATEEVLKIASELDPDRDRDRLAQIIDDMSNLSLNEAMIAALNSGSFKKAAIVIELMSRFEGPEVSKVLMDAFESGDRDIKRGILEALVATGGDETKVFFENILETEQDGSMLKSAINFLGLKLKDAGAIDGIFALLNHAYDDVKEAALDACVAIGGEDVNRRFVELFNSNEAIDRLMAVFAMGKIDSKGNIEYIKRALGDELPDIRKIALEALHDCCSDEESMSLIFSRLHDENRDVRLTVIELLGNCYKEEVIPYIIQALQDDDDWVQIRAAEALGEHREESALPQLITMLDSPHKIVVIKVIEVLGAIGGTMAFQALLEASNADADPEIVQTAEEAILRIQEEQGEGK
ncbi:HEAT repeat domain-containing protein [Maridesulfovibrio hydrothermalis]|uniref:PBS lyase HEAT domain protein repeat-containing protein n=1 Tax=Maridesulfovibrio hydrothermalis AM13 = DSM 14728 TaxID=1121451 RepID=L0RBA0_9BACT|nr:HEAT repeat domain-containing protein [Maridesulfovibrio hydrothermalis]CCO24063.1 PBS lyase HEAT domain protein repeat-containing protein [Maridesulfovibrio hydrothermalis AM13 = DSM 14728]